jgi:hypothetical protein
VALAPGLLTPKILEKRRIAGFAGLWIEFPANPKPELEGLTMAIKRLALVAMLAVCPSFGVLGCKPAARTGPPAPNASEAPKAAAPGKTPAGKTEPAAKTSLPKEFEATPDINLETPDSPTDGKEPAKK